MTADTKIQFDAFYNCIPVLDRILKKNSPGGYEITGLGEDVRVLIAALAVREYGKKVLYVCGSDEEAKRVRLLARRFLSHNEVGFFPSHDLIPYESIAANDKQKIERIEVLEGLSADGSYLAVISVDAAVRRIIPPKVWRDAFLLLRVGDIIEPQNLIEKLYDMGYVRDTLTEEPGSFSVRGSVVDVYPPGSEYPFRIDFFDDEIESLRSYDSENQVSREEVSEITICPGAPFFIPSAYKSIGIEKLKSETEELCNRLKGEKKKRCKERTERLLDYIEAGSLSDVTEQTMPYFFKESYFEDYIEKNDLIIVSGPSEIRRKLLSAEGDNASVFRELFCEGELLPSYSGMIRGQEIFFATLNKKPLLSFSYLYTPSGLDTVLADNISVREFSFYRSTEERTDEIKELSKKSLLYLCVSNGNAEERLNEFICDNQIKNCKVIYLPLEKSLECSNPSVCFISEHEFGFSGKQHSVNSKKKKKKPISSFIDLKEGDYVVHDTHGIGRYVGIERIEISGKEKDYLLIRYEGTDKLYIPTDQMDILQKYIGDGDEHPRVNKLGGKDWQHAKEKVRGSVKKMAEELIRLYAEREKEQGFAFSPDSDWQVQMEEDFPFEETPDQADAIAEVKSDMEKNRPMDRLLCGDVGYGKTEVAIRAAFKAVLDGKQVAVLVPTTVLAQQHERTFSDRLEKFGVRIDGLNRFKPKKEIDRVFSGISSGEIDIVIGTHMLFNKNAVFHDLGLLIIDEEQRFGVAHKEKIKALKKNIDVLAMSATPIPRTLHMSLVGVRDISIIETPPKYRMPVKTYVMEYQRRLVKEAIEREIDRGGQIFYVHNRVESLDRIAAELKQMVPQAEIVIGHGQMRKSSLEVSMLGFIRREADILLCTTIVEAGLDIPNVNTLIVDNADRFGLSQMYQIRGRVGRSRRQAFAYFFYPKGKLLNEPAQKRLAAVRDYTDLGSGFKIAMRDMEIRGAGNILGAEQHGHMLSVGFEMYCRLIDEEVKRLSGAEQQKPAEEVSVNVLCSAYLPDDYIGDKEIKINVYRRISEIDTPADLKVCISEIEDRFGSIPNPVYHLFLVIRLKLSAVSLEISDITQKKGCFLVSFCSVNGLTGKEIELLHKEYGRIFEFKMTDRLVMKICMEKLSDEKALLKTAKILAFLEKNRKA